MPKPKRPIIQLDLKGNKIESFPSTYHAQEKTGIDREYILKVLKGKRRRTYNFTWAYENSINLP